MPRPAIESNVHGIKCDTPECDFRDESVRAEDYEQWIDAPCPKCGASLLTPEDMAAVKALMAMADWINAVCPEQPDSTPTHKVKLEFDGSGIPKAATSRREHS